MSRETNSLLLRYGINTFWSTSLFFPKLFSTKLQLISFLKLLLSNYFFSTLKIQYITTLLILYLFYYKNDRFSYIYKFLKITNISITQLIFRKFFSFKLGTQNQKVYVNDIFFSFFLLIQKLFLSFTLYHLLIKFTSFLMVITELCLFNIIPECLALFKIKKISFYWNWKLKIINHLLKFKWLGIFIACLIYTYTKKRFNVVLKSILEQSFFSIRFPFFFKYLRNIVAKQKFYLILLSFLFFKTQILNTYLNLLIKKTKNKKHIKNLIFFFNELRLLFEKQFVCISGLKFKIAGRLGGKLRRSSYGYKLGFLPLMSLKTCLDFSCDFVYTQYGSFSLKLWFCEINKQLSILL